MAATLRRVAANHPHRVAIVDADGRRTTYRALADSSARLAGALRERGLVPGDRVAAWLGDSCAYVETYLACAHAGLVVVPLNSRHTVHEVATVLADCSPRALVWDSRKDAEVDALALGGVLGGVVRVRHDTTGRSGPEALDLAELTAHGTTEVPVVPGRADLVVIGYTSGTTGRPKGALLTNRSVLAVMRQNAAAYRLPRHSVIAMTGSMSFVSVVPAHVLTHLAVAGTVVFQSSWDVPSLLDTVERHRATFTYLPSPVLAEFAELAERRPEKWRSLVSILHSASKAPVEDLRRLADVVGSRLVEGWGLTENSGGLATATTAVDIDASREDGSILETVGRPIPGYEVRVVDEELEVRGPGVVNGYWRQPDVTASSFVDGWFRTGDVGTIDEAGYVRVLERRTDLIVSGGMNVYPAEVESVIAAMPGVAEVAVVGVPHQRWGQTVAAMVVPRPGGELRREDIEARCRERLASYKKPTAIAWAAELPRTTSLKVSRAAVRAQILEQLLPTPG